MRVTTIWQNPPAWATRACPEFMPSRAAPPVRITADGMTLEAVANLRGPAIVRHIGGFVNVRGTDHYLDGFLYFDEEGAVLSRSLPWVARRVDEAKVTKFALSRLAPAFVP